MPGLRLLLTINCDDKMNQGERLDITDFVIELGPLCCGMGETGDVPQAESIRLRLVGDERFNPRKSNSVFKEYGSINLDIYKDGEHIFFGALAGSPRPDESAECAAVTLDFVGGLKGLWSQSVDGFAESKIAYADVELDTWPLLLNSALHPVVKSKVDISPIETEEDVWSAAARPHIALPGYDPVQTERWDIVSPIECGGSVYAGFGPFLLSYAEAAGEWNIIAKASAHDDVEWFISHLEYDISQGMLFGVVVANEGDLTKRTAHLRATFSLGV
jgi:hypothetical protein